jgi:hypothetical protein
MSTDYKRHIPLRHEQRAIHLSLRRLLHDDIHELLLSINPQRKREFNWQVLAEVVLIQLVEPQLTSSIVTLAEADVRALGATEREAKTIIAKLKLIKLLIPAGRGSKVVGHDENGKPILKRGFAYYTVAEKFIQQIEPTSMSDAWIITYSECQVRGITDAREQAHTFWSAKDIARSRLKKDRLTPTEVVWGLEQLFKDRAKRLARLDQWGGRP